MKAIFRKLRGALGTAVTWAVGWAVSGFALISVTTLVAGNSSFFWDTVGPVTLLAGLSGFVGGTVFSTVLAAVHGRRRLSELSPLRMALWGAGAALLVPVALLGIGMLAGVPLEADVAAMMALGIGGLGAATAGGMVKLAQAGDRELEGPGAEPRLTSGDRRSLRR